MNCLFHKFDKKIQTIVQLNISIFGRNSIEERVLIIEQCSKCKKKKTYTKDNYGDIEKQDYDFIIAFCKNGKEVEEYFNE